ncbi:MAG TPA: transaldolase [Solirubrobacterales bacterium]|nr:transaldolase [Solirubrobacterales bacterium]
MNENNKRLHDQGQSLWVDNITRAMLDDGTLAKYIAELSVTGLTSNPTIFEKAIGGGSDYDAQIAELAATENDPEGIFFELAITDLRRAADLFADTAARTHGVDGFVSLEVSPLLADDTDGTISQAVDLHARAERDNLFIKIPGTPAGLPAIEEAIFRGVPVNVTLLFSREQYLAAADAYMKGVERRIEAGLDPAVNSVASLFISRWDAAVINDVSDELRAKLGIAIGQRTYAAYRELIASDRAQRLANEGAMTQRLLMASTGTKDPDASDVLYIEALGAPNTVNTMPEAALLAYADHGVTGAPISPDGGDAEEVLASYAEAGFDVDALAARLQDEGKVSFEKSWHDLIDTIRQQIPG